MHLEIHPRAAVKQNRHDEEYIRHPCSDIRMMVVFLKGAGYSVNQKQERRFMR
jgi:hypothetical protein